MTDTDSPSNASSHLHRVTDPRQAELLTDPTSKQYFAPFLAQHRTVKDAATLVGCALNTMLYRVKVMLGAGLIEVVERRPRAGRTVKVYRSVHDGYFVPFGTTPYATLEDRVAAQGKPIFARLTKAYSAALHEHEHSGHALMLNEHGAVYTTDLPPETTRDGRPVLFRDITVHLDAAQAQAVAAQLAQAFGAAEQRGQASEHTSEYMVMVALVPLGN
jgi:hypothetical protein